MVTLSSNKASGGTWQQNIGNCLSLFHHQDTQITNHIQAHIVLNQAPAPSTPELDKPSENKSGCMQSNDLGAPENVISGTTAGGNKKKKMRFFKNIAFFAVFLADIWFRYSITASTVLLLV
ncbi:uncharacterized protein TrAtP1_004475 [Trichoderma atroviride]|uniref:uncharacterized protein n=1 Tax=Hypocrea atroviridis TaxID=63577 RepID=UPI0033236151|nr:hypothetical protein TrAtP1_004475 [Trichoderma atroviride]